MTYLPETGTSVLVPVFGKYVMGIGDATTTPVATETAFTLE